jgi:hypothetical protein
MSMEKTPSPPLTEAKRREIAHQVRMRMIQIDHEIRLAEIKRKSAENRRRLAENRRQEERVSNAVLDLSVATWRLKGSIAAAKGEAPPPLDLTLAKDMTRRVGESIPRDTDPEVIRYRRHIAALCQELGVKPKFVVEFFRQGYAWSSLKEIELPPINGRFSYAIGMHEAAHCACPCEKSHVRVKTENGETVCVKCELAAWKWAIAHAVAWEKDMHEAMVGGLSSYRKFGTPAEQAEIDAMISPLGFRRAQLACVLKESH